MFEIKKGFNAEYLALREQQEKRAALRARLADCTEYSILSHEALAMFERGEVTREQWRRWGVQRHIASEQFELLLVTARDVAAEQEQTDLAHELHVNLCDERGVDVEGNALLFGSHKEWKAAFFHRLGISDDDFLVPPTAGTAAYLNVLQSLIQERNLVDLCGALLFLEYSIPEEFKRLKAGRDIVFAKEFLRQAGDSKAVVTTKRDARRYLDHHIGHDATKHFPDLERAILSAFTVDDIPQLERGMVLVAQAKKDFYDSIQEFLI